MFLIAGLALITLCISLIQEQIGRSAAIALGVKNLVIEIDEVEIIPRRKNFLTSNETPEDISAGTTTAVAVVPIPEVDGDNDEIEETGIPGEVDEEDNEEDNDENEGDEEDKEEDNEEKEDEEDEEDDEDEDEDEDDDEEEDDEEEEDEEEDDEE